MRAALLSLLLLASPVLAQIAGTGGIIRVNSSGVATGDVESVTVTGTAPLTIGGSPCTSGACSLTAAITGLVYAAHVWDLVQSTNAQKLRIFQSDDGVGNANWLELYYDGAYWTQMVVRPNKSGTGTQRSLVLQGDPTTPGSAIELTSGGGNGKLLYAGSGQVEWSSTGTYLRPVTASATESGDATHPWEKTWTDALAITATASPASNAACSAGSIYWDADYIYVCTASGAVKRAALTGGY